MKALVLNGKVCQVCEEEFPVAEPLQWFECNSEVTTDWLYADGKFNAPVNKEKTFSEIVADFEQAVQAELDADAQAKGYDNILSACAYAGAPNPFQAEAELYVSRRGNVWAYCYQELAKVQAGTRSMPTIEEIIAELPPRVST